MEDSLFPDIDSEFQKKTKNFILFSDKNKKYNLFIQSELNSKIIITAIDVIKQTKYSESYTLDTLKYNKYLSLFDSIEEIFDELNDKIAKIKPKLYEEDNSIKLIIKTFHTKYKEINFYLKEKDKNINEKYNELIFIINELKEKEKKQDEKIKSLEDIVQELKNNNNELFQKNLLLEKSFEYLRGIINNINNINYYNPGVLYNQEIGQSQSLEQISSSPLPYIPNSMRDNNNGIKINLNIDQKPYIPKNFKENKV